jgi:hypothetical protein
MDARALVGFLIVITTGCSLGNNDRLSQQPAEFMGWPLLLDTDFDGQDAGRWGPSDPAAWEFTRDGERTVYALARRSRYKPPFRSPEGISVLKDICVSDFVLDVWLRSTKKDYPHRDLCVFFGHQDPAHFYYVHFGLKSDQSSNTIHIVNGADRTPIVKTRTDGTPWTEGYHHVRVVRKVETGMIEAYFDDMTKPAMTAQDSTLRWGRVGIGSFDDVGCFDRMMLWGRKVECPESARAY